MPHPMPDKYWEAVATFLEGRVKPGELLLAPNDFLPRFPGTIALHVRKRMIPHERIAHFVLPFGMLDRVDPEFLREASTLVPVFASSIFVVFSREGEKLPLVQRIFLNSFGSLTASLPDSPRAGRTVFVVTTYNRPRALERCLASLSQQQCPIVVVDDGSSEEDAASNRDIARAHGSRLVSYSENRGIAHAINSGVEYWLADPASVWISIFNDDIEVVNETLNRLDKVVRGSPFIAADCVYTGYLDPKHPVREKIEIAGEAVTLAWSCPAKHMHAHRSYWQSVLPVPTAYPGAPKPAGGVFKGQGSDADWWIASWAPRAATKRGGHVVVIPGLVSSFGRESSTWGNPD
jgi:hypothetical protein